MIFMRYAMAMQVMVLHIRIKKEGTINSHGDAL